MCTTGIILKVLDARDPMGCRCMEAERLFRSTGPEKRVILVLNKIDLVPKAVVTQWMKLLRNEYPTIAFKASTHSTCKIHTVYM
jgi:nuclear GTP-binding protein